MPPGQPTRGPSVSRTLSLLAAFAAVSVLAGILASGLVMPAVGATGALARSSVNFFDSLPAELNAGPLSQQSKILAADGSQLATFYSENRIVVPLDQIAPVMRQAIVAIEDSRFYQHGGIDPKGLARAFVNNSSGGSTQGASTLTQQYVKNVLIEKAVEAGDKNAIKAAVAANGAEGYGRKLRELKLAITVEKKQTKDQILAGYLNIALFADNTYGVEAAALHFFGKHAKDLTLPESAMLAGMVNSPNVLNPRTSPKRALERRNVVLERMLEVGVITQAQHDEAVKAPVQLNLQPTGNGCAAANYSAGFFCDYVYRLLLNDKAFGADAAARKALLMRGGLTVQTTLDPRVQKITQDAVFANVSKDNGPVGAAAVVLEPGTGKILAMAENRDYNPSANAPPGSGAVNYTTDFAYGGSAGFQPGSTFKPFTLATWLANGKSLNDRINVPVKGNDPFSAFKSSCYRLDPNTRYTYGNAGDGEGGGNMSVLEATYRSINTAYVTMEKQLDLCQIRDTAQSLGVHLATPVKDAAGNPTSQIVPLPSLTLGAQNVSPLTMSAAYATFASGGTYCNPVAITAVTDSKGKQLAVPAADCKPNALNPDVAKGVNYALQRVLGPGGTAGPGIAIGRPAAGKTGTADDSIDTWFNGYTPNLVATVWVGLTNQRSLPNNQKQNLANFTINGNRYRAIYGATIAAPLWKQIMTQAPEVLGLPAAPFADPNSTVLNGPMVTVPTVAGMAPADAVNAINAAGLKGALGGAAASDTVPAGQAAGTSPGAGTQVPPGSTVTVIVSSGPAPSPSPTTAPPTNGGSPPPGNGGGHG